MIKLSSLLALTLFFGITASAGAADIKIGVVNIPRVLKDSPQSVAASTRMEKEFSKRQGELVKRQRELQEQEEKYNRDSAVMSQQERQSTEKDLVSRGRELKRLQDEFREDYELRNKEETEQVQRVVIQAIDALVKEEGYDLVLGEGVIYGKPLDITDKLLERLKKTQASTGK